MHLLLVTNLYPPHELGGYGRAMAEFACGLAERGHRIDILTSDGGGGRAAVPDSPGILRTLRLAGEWRGGEAVTLDDPLPVLTHNHQEVARVVARLRPQAALIGNIDFLSDLIPELLLRLGLPAVHHLGNRWPGLAPEHLPASPFYHMAFNSAWLRRAAESDGYHPLAASVIPPGVRTTLFADGRERPQDGLRLLFAGLLLPYKGPQVLLRALIRLGRAGVPFQATFAGDTTDPAFAAALADMARMAGLGEQVRFAGHLGREALVAAMHGANVLVFPSVFDEPFGMSQVEAMAAGLAVVTSASGGSGEIVLDGVTGLHFRNEDDAHLAQCLTRLAGDAALRRSLGAAGRERAKLFSVEHSVAVLEAEFTRLIAAAKGTER